MIGYRFTEYVPKKMAEKGSFENLLDIFLQLMVITGGDVSETVNWFTNLDREYNLMPDDYGMGNFVDDLKDQGYIKEGDKEDTYEVTAKSEQKIRKNALEEIFGKLKKGSKGDHKTPYFGQGDETTTDFREFQFGDPLDQIALRQLGLQGKIPGLVKSSW